MKNVIENLIFWIGSVRFIFHLFIFYFHPKKDILIKERNQWIKVILNSENYSLYKFIWLLKFIPEYRSVYYFRVGRISHLLRILAYGRESLYLNMPSKDVGSGLVIQHGFSSIVEAIKIGTNCQIWHNVTIGTNISHSGNNAIIGDNVKVCAGAIVIGKIRIGNNVTIGAGSLIVKDVPNNCTVIGNPATIIRKNGVPVNMLL